MGVSKDRFVAGSILAQRDPRAVFVLDDGFQHRKLARDLDIVIIDGSRPLLSDRIFPRGTLREPIFALRRCDAVVINGPFDSPDANSIEAEIRGLQANARIFRCNQFVQRLVPFLSWQKTASFNPEEFPPIPTPGCRLAARKPAGLPSAFLVCALGNPERFQRDIRRLGIGGPGAKFFSDHHRISPKDWRNCAEEASRKGADALITTEKDAVKISEPPDSPLLVAMQSTEMADAHEFELVLKKCIEERR
jgi:tetraacyldisaccharide 4'-kinase